MNRCLITYLPTSNGSYSKQGLAKLSPRLTALEDIPYTAKELRKEASLRSVKMSIAGVQPKLSAKLSVKNSALEIVDNKGTYIIKPPSDLFDEVPENEDVTMKMAKVFGIEVPLTGLVKCKDGSLSYFIKRFDRYAKTKKYQLEDFAQLTLNKRSTKYNWSMEKIVPVLNDYCTFPLLEKRKLLRRVLFCFITGNEDMHLKNFSLITRENKIELSPAYDFLNSSIAMGEVVEELALPLAGKKSRLKRKHFFDYYAKERLELSDKSILSEMHNLVDKKNDLVSLIKVSFLSKNMKEEYLKMMENRYDRLLKK